MTSENVTEAEISEATAPQPARAVDDRLIDELVSRAQAEGLQLTGEGGLSIPSNCGDLLRSHLIWATRYSVSHGGDR